MAHEEFQSDLDELLRAAELACVSGSQQLLEKVRCFAGKYTASAPVSHCPSDAELRVLSKECEKMPGGLGMHYVNYGRAVLARWGCVRDRVVKESNVAVEYGSDGVMKWERVIPPVPWPAANAVVVADRHLPDGTRQHMIQGSVQRGLVIANAQVIGQDDVHDAEFASVLSHLSK